MTRLARLSVLLVATLGVACAPSPQPSASPSPAAQVQPSPPPTVTPTKGVATAAPAATPSPTPAAIATPCAICSKLGGYDVAGGFCSGQECLFRPTYGDRDYLVGVATFNGYYTRVEKFGFGQQSAVCDSFVVVRGPSELIRLTLAQVDAGNGINSKNAANQPVVSINLGALTALEANQVRASTARDPVALIVVARSPQPRGAPLCYSQFDIMRVN